MRLSDECNDVVNLKNLLILFRPFYSGHREEFNRNGFSPPTWGLLKRFTPPQILRRHAPDGDVVSRLGQVCRFSGGYDR